MKLHDRLQAFLNQDDTECSAIRRQTIRRTKEALNVIDDCYTRFRDEEIAISYNGGKDCLVLLVLLVAFLESRSDKYERRQKSIKSVYVAIKDPFQEVDDFVAESAEEYGLDVLKIQKPMKEAFGQYLHDHPAIRAILVGTRRDDPHGAKLSYFDETDQGWPKFMRVHPIINWQYAEVWDFLLALQVPYCALYDRGYTSLGGTGDTLPNPSLEIRQSGELSNGKAEEARRYKPAWELHDGGEERKGRERAREQGHKVATNINMRKSVDMDRIRS